MTMKRWDGASQIDLTIAKRWDGASHVDLTLAKRWDGASWVDITLPGGGGGTLSATADINPVTTETIEFEGHFTHNLTSYLVTVTAAGGTGPYTYAWTRLYGSSTVLCDAPTSAATRFSCSIYSGNTRTAVYRCTVTDSLSATAYVDISVIMTR